MEKSYCVYMHTNKINGKKYIGITGRNPSVRWNNGKGYKSNPHFYNAIKKYGWDNFTHDILYTNLTKDESCIIEIELIKDLNLQNPNFGYNNNSGGEHSKASLQTIDKISKNMIERWKNDDFREKMNCRRSAMACKVFFDGQIFDSIQQFNKTFNVCASVWLQGKGSIPKEFVEKGLSLVGYDMNYEQIEGFKHFVVCENIMYKNVKDCAEYYNVKYDTMKQWLNGKRKMPKIFQEKGLRLEHNIRYIAHPKKL